jgi:hypothetical protein
MSKRRPPRQHVTARRPKQVPQGITTAPAAPASPDRPGAKLGRTVAICLGGLVLAAIVPVTVLLYLSGRLDGRLPFQGRAATARDRPAERGEGEGEKDDSVWERIERQVAAREKWVPEEWRPQSEADRVINQFARLHNAGNPAAGKLLGRVPEVPNEPVTEAEAERLQTDFLLRLEGTRIVRILRGEPDVKGGLKDTPGRYTFLTKGGGNVPELRVRTRDGVENRPRGGFNFDLIVAVRAGKVFGVRAGLHDWPW